MCTCLFQNCVIGFLVTSGLHLLVGFREYLSGYLRNSHVCFLCCFLFAYFYKTKHLLFPHLNTLFNPYPPLPSMSFLDISWWAQILKEQKPLWSRVGTGGLRKTSLLLESSFSNHLVGATRKLFPLLLSKWDWSKTIPSSSDILRSMHLGQFQEDMLKAQEWKEG